MRKVLWTENSVQDLLAIKTYISQASPHQAEEWILELYNTGESLTSFALRGRIVPEFKDENIRELLIESYRLVYQVQATSVAILTIFESHRQLNIQSLKK